MALERKSFATDDPQRSEEAPTADEAGLPGREADLFDGEKLVVAENVSINQEMPR